MPSGHRSSKDALKLVSKQMEKHNTWRPTIQGIVDACERQEHLVTIEATLDSLESPRRDAWGKAHAYAKLA